MFSGTFKCMKCNKVFEEFVDNSEVKTIKCECGGIAKRGFWSSNSGPNVVISKKNQSAPKENNQMDGGVPFGEVPGDDDYKWMEEGRDYGPTP